MTRLTPVFLVLLRLAIGWHFFFEGVGKLPPDTWPVRALRTGHPEQGLAQAKKDPFSSEAYLRESAGPLAPHFRELAGDTVLDRVQVTGVKDGDLPPALAADWDEYFQRFTRHYALSDQPAPRLVFWTPAPQSSFPASVPWVALLSQRDLANSTYEQTKAAAADWLRNGVKKVKIELPGGATVEVERTTPERVQAYVAQVEKARGLQDREMTIFGGDVNARLRAAKADAGRMRAELRKDLDDRMLEMKKSLHELLTAKQREQPVENRYNVSTWETQLVPADDPIQASWRDMTRLQWADWLTRWGLFAVGCLLLLGLCTRTACVAGAGYLLLFYLSLPALPGLPDNPRAEGSYLFVNKNIIEMLALLALATTASGKWVGLDGLVQFLNPFRRGAPQAPPPADAGGSLAAGGSLTAGGAPVVASPALTNGTTTHTSTAEPAPVPVHTPEPRESDHGH